MMLPSKNLGNVMSLEFAAALIAATVQILNYLLLRAINQSEMM